MSYVDNFPIYSIVAVQYNVNMQENLESHSQTKKIALALGAAILVGFVAYYFSVTRHLSSLQELSSGGLSSAANITLSVPEPQKTDFGPNMPADFPANIPFEQGVKMEQSYALDYPEQKQLTVNFASLKTVKQNYDLYEAFLNGDKWTISNRSEDEKISSLYGAKGNNEINITIALDETAGRAKVSISVLKK